MNSRPSGFSLHARKRGAGILYRPHAAHCHVSAAVANAIHNAIGVRVRDYPITVDKLIERLPSIG